MRKYISIVLALTFILVSVTGLQMIFTGGGGSRGNGKYPMAQSQPFGKMNAGSGYGPGGGKYAIVQNQSIGNIAANSSQESRQQSFYPNAAHKLGGFIFIIAGAVHLGLNFKSMRSYFRIKSQKLA